MLIVCEMVCLAACLARSVETKLLTKSFKLPLTTGEVKRSSLEADEVVEPVVLLWWGDSPPPLLLLLGSVLFIKEGEVNVEVGLDKGEALPPPPTEPPFFTSPTPPDIW